MALPSVFSSETSNQLLQRIDKLTESTQAEWGKMDVAQMLAHCSVTYEMIYTDIHPKPGAFKRALLKLFLKGSLTSENPYKKSSPTAPEFIIKSSKDFSAEKKRLKDYLQQVQQEGADKFEGKESNSFGAMTATEWSNLMYKHLDHHLMQFGI
jgi:Protein of unknown function (DUF1569)